MKDHEHISKFIKYLIFALLFLTAFLERTIFDLGPNYELVTSIMILCVYFLGRKQSFWLTFLLIAATDRFLGNSKIFLFTWSGFLIPVLLIGVITKIRYSKSITPVKKMVSVFKLTLSGVSANLFFYFWTNLGVWLLDSWSMYTKDLPGLIGCYINALPFLKNQITSSLIFIPLGVVLIEHVISLSHYLSTISTNRIFQIRKTSG
jgi:hypothetical protein